jgi:K+:H+ antiporter
VHDSQDFLRNLAVVLGVAAVTTVVCERLRLPVVFGYMLAGLIIGPHVPIPLVADPDMVHTLSELGVILLMFSLGLEFNLRRLVSTGWGVVIVAVLQSSFTGWLGYETGRILGWSSLASLYTGAAVAISSTTIVVKALADHGARGRFTDLVFGVLIVEDLIAILLLAVLTPAGTPGANSAVAVGWAFLRLFAVLAGLLVVGLLLVPRFVRFVVGLRRSEITLVVSVGLCFSIALLVRSFGYSVALGSFLAGALVAESGEEKRIERLVDPVRAMFGAIFFVSVGMMLVPATVLEHWGTVASLTLLVIAGKIGAVSVASFLTGTGIRTAVQSGMSLAQIGEFSFIIASAGIATGATPAPLYPIVVAVSALTTLSTPWLIRLADPVAAWVDKSLPRPLQTFAALYGTWIESMRSRPATSEDRLRLGRALRALVLDASAIIGVSLAMRPLVGVVTERTPLQPPLARGLVVGAAMVLSVPFLGGIVRTGQALGSTLSRRAFPEPQPGKLDLAAAPRRALIVGIQFATVVMVGAPLVAVTQPFLPAFMGVAFLLVMIAVLGVLVWRNATDLQGHVHAAAEAIV